MSKKKRNHIVPKVYLKAFSNEDDNTVNILVKNRKTIIENIDIKNVAVEKNFYIQHEKDGTRITKTEDELANIENQLIRPTLTRFMNYAAAPIPDGDLHISYQYKKDLVDTVVSQMLRGKKARILAEKKSEETYYELLHELVQLRKLKRITQEQLRIVEANKDRLLKNGVIESSNSAVLSNSLIKDLLMNRTLFLIRNSLDVPFVTSDEPVLFVNMKGESGIYKTALREAGTIVYYPLCPNVMVSFISNWLIGASQTDRLMSLSNHDRDFVISMNSYQYQQANECVISNSVHALKTIRTDRGRFVI